MRAYRIASRRFPVVSGAGAQARGGRWNSRGRAVIYAADSFALAMLERLVYVLVDALPPQDHWVEITIPDDALEVADVTAIPGWDAIPPGPSQRFGDQWLAESRSLALAVPSVVTGIDRNIVLNPSHPRFADLVISEERLVTWDPRLFAR